MNYTKATFCAFLFASLGACGSEPGPPAAATPAASTPPAAQAAGAIAPLASMARAVGSGKPGAAVDIRYDFLARPAVGTPIPLKIVLVPNAGVSALEATISGMDGITLSGALSASFANVQAGQPYEHTVTVLPERSGVFYVTVSVGTRMGEQTLGRTFSVPLVVGNVPARQKAAPAKDGSGEVIESLPARESTD